MSGSNDFLKLKEVEFFSDLSEDECASLFPLLNKEIFHQGDIVVRQGENLDRMFFVLKGCVGKEKSINTPAETGDSGHRRKKDFFETRGPGDHFGAAALVAKEKTPADWVSLDETLLLSLTVEVFEKILLAGDSTAQKILLSLCKSLHRSSLKSKSLVAAGLENKRLLSNVLLEKKKIKAMHSIAGSTALSDVRHTLDTILQACMDCLEVEKGAIMIFDRGVLRVEAAFGKNKEKILGQIQRIDDTSVSGRCFITQQAVFIQDIDKVKELRRSPDPSQYINNSLISMPLVSMDGESIGVLNVSKTSQGIFSDKDLKILDDLSREASSALGHEVALARLYRKFQEIFVEVEHAQKQLVTIEEKIGRVMQTSWPSFAKKGGKVNE